MEEFFGQVEGFFRSLPADRFSTLVAQVDNLIDADGIERFEFGLDLILRGLASRVGGADPAGPTTKG